MSAASSKRGRGVGVEGEERGGGGSCLTAGYALQSSNFTCAVEILL